MSIWPKVSFNELYLEPSLNGLTRPRRVRGAGYKMVNMGELFAFDRIRNPPMELVPMNEREIEKYSLMPGDLLFARQSLVREGAGKISIVMEIPEITTFEGHLIRVRLDAQKANPLFYYYYLSSPIGKAKMQTIAMQVAAAGIRGSELATIQVPFPPLNEQKIISTLLSETDLGIESINEAIKHIKLLKKGLMQRLLTRGIGHTKFKKTKIGEIPEEWATCKLDEICGIRTERYNPVTEEAIPYIGLEHIGSEQAWIDTCGISSETTSQKTCFGKGNVLFGKLRPYLRKVAMTTHHGVCSTDILSIVANERVGNEFLLWLLSSTSSISHAVKTSEGTKMPRTSWKSMRNLTVPLPSLEEQRRISDILGTANWKIQLETKQIKNLQELKIGLMQTLLTGRVRVNLKH